MLEHSQTINSGIARPMFLVPPEEKACELKIDCNKNGLLKNEIHLNRRNAAFLIVFFSHYQLNHHLIDVLFGNFL